MKGSWVNCSDIQIAAICNGVYGLVGEGGRFARTFSNSAVKVRRAVVLAIDKNREPTVLVGGFTRTLSRSSHEE
jgi:hypothetical protein